VASIYPEWAFKETVMRVSDSMQRLVDQLRKLPGVGPKSASRMAFHILKMDESSVAGLADAMVAAKVF
jgi:recombinational DNA repair protein RecR